MKVLYFESAEKKPEVMDIPNTLEDLQKAVNGYIQYVPLEKANAGLICNEEGKFNGLLPNRPLPEIHDVIYGPFLICGTSDEDFSDVTEAMVEAYRDL